MSAREILIALSVKYHNEWDKMYKAFMEKEYPEITEEIEMLAEDDNIITILDEQYPQQWKQIYKPPLVIFAHPILNNN